MGVIESYLACWAFFLLALGDTGHVGFRVAAYALGGMEKTACWCSLAR
jgi:hypothetical protein